MELLKDDIEPSDIEDPVDFYSKVKGWTDEQHVPANNGLNGQILSGITIPPEIVEQILAHVAIDDILTANKVCRAWKNFTSSTNFWKHVFQNHKLPWNCVPEDRIQNKEGFSSLWILFWAIVKNNGFKGNLLRNASGEEGLEGWEVYAESSHIIHEDPVVVVEKPPNGCGCIPDTQPQSCFATSYLETTLSQSFQVKFSPYLMVLLIPFEIHFSIMYSCRFDCAGEGSFKVFFKNEPPIPEINSYELLICERYFEATCPMDWEIATYLATFLRDRISFNPKFRVEFGGRDFNYWRGYYGTKFSRLGAFIKLI